MMSVKGLICGFVENQIVYHEVRYNPFKPQFLGGLIPVIRVDPPIRFREDRRSDSLVYKSIQSHVYSTHAQ